MTDTETAHSMAYSLILGAMQKGIPVTPDLIADKVAFVLTMLRTQNVGLEVEGSLLTRELESLFSMQMGSHVALDSDNGHERWLKGRQSEIAWKFWSRYERYLREVEKLPVRVVERLGEVTDAVLDRLGDPARTEPWSRRGMVVGQVQSGKTANFTGLICKSADAGYKVIVVLSGMHNSLRAQTQLRLDTGFLGFNTRYQRELDRHTENALLGVGTLPTGEWLHALSGTTSEERGDFSGKAARQFGVPPGGAPVLLVVKKNKTVLNALIGWAVRMGVARLRGVPLLVIDDEADNASINTRPPEDSARDWEECDPSTINGLIRRLLGSFEESSYVGYTATPFANIFIPPAASATGFGPDLFPRDFIVHLRPPANYMGPAQVFGLESSDPEADEGLGIIRAVDDESSWVPADHKNHHVLGEMPPSLREAMRAFILVCAARRARGQDRRHNSMLIHVTRYTSVQGAVFDQVDDELAALKRRIRYLEGNASGGPSIIDELRLLWERDFVPTTEQVRHSTLLEGTPQDATSWSQVEAHLAEAADAIRVKRINGTVKDYLDYAENPDGISVIAIGGDKLSRGLTLEGLSISYYLRPAKSYDTLMQMGRWFGYRPGYADLCRLYTTPQLVSWYRHVAKSDEELRAEFEYMEEIGASPENFGLKVLAHPDADLVVTAANKMRSAVHMSVSMIAEVAETHTFHASPAPNLANFRRVERLIADLGRPSSADVSRSSHVWSGLPADVVRYFLEDFAVHPRAKRANAQLLIDYITSRNREDELTSWTVALVSNSQAAAEDMYVIGGREVGLIHRTRVEFDEAPDQYRLPNARLLNPADELIGLTSTQLAEVRERTRLKREENNKPNRGANAVDGKIIRSVRGPGHGLLLLYPLLTPTDVDSPVPVMGFVVSFPDSARARKRAYVVNSTYADQYEYGVS